MNKGCQGFQNVIAMYIEFNTIRINTNNEISRKRNIEHFVEKKCTCAMS